MTTQHNYNPTKVDQVTNSPAISVMLVDDQPEIRLLVRKLLLLAGGFDVVGEAANGAEAIDMAGNLLPDVIVLDVSMPIVGGIEAITPIRMKSPNTKLVMFSSCDDPKISGAAFELGALAYIPKQDSHELPAKVREIHDMN